MTVRTSRTSQLFGASLAITVGIALAGCNQSQPAAGSATQTQGQQQAQVQTPGQTTPQTQVVPSTGVATQTTTPDQNQTGVQAQGSVPAGTTTPVVSQTTTTQVPSQQVVQSGTTKRTHQVVPKTEVQPPVKSVPTVQSVVLPVGTSVSGTLETAVSSDKSNVGDAVVLRTTEPVVVDGQTVVAVGSAVHGTVTHVRAAGRVKGASEITVRFTTLDLEGGKSFPITADPIRRVAKGDGKESAAEIGGGAAVGGILGGVLGGKGGALKGGALGAALGTGVALAGKGEQVVLPVGHSMKVTLTAPVTLVSGENP